MVAARSGRDVMLRRARPGGVLQPGARSAYRWVARYPAPAAPGRRSAVMRGGLCAEGQMACVGGLAVARRGRVRIEGGFAGNG